MTKIERETIISWNDEEETVNVWTCHTRIMNKMKRLGAKVKDKTILGGKIVSMEFVIPKDKVNIGLNPKRSSNNLGSEARKAAGVRLSLARKEALKNVSSNKGA